MRCSLGHVVVVLTILAMAACTGTDGPAACDPDSCFPASRIIGAAEAMQMKRRLGADILVVDIRGRVETFFTGIPLGVDAQVHFDEPAPALFQELTTDDLRMQVRPDFPATMESLLRSRGMQHDAQVVLLGRSGESAVAAALILQRYGYSRVLVIRDGFEGFSQAADGSAIRARGGWKNSGLPWAAVQCAHRSSACAVRDSTQASSRARLALTR